MELILNQFVKKTSSTRGQSLSKLGAKRLIKRSVCHGVDKKIVRCAKPVTKLIYGVDKDLDKLVNSEELGDMAETIQNGLESGQGKRFGIFYWITQWHLIC